MLKCNRFPRNKKKTKPGERKRSQLSSYGMKDCFDSTAQSLSVDMWIFPGMNAFLIEVFLSV